MDITTQGNIRFLSNHRTLALVGKTLAEAVGPAGADLPPTDIWIGAHRTRKVPRISGRRLVVVQTEQILAENGQQIWQKMTRRRIFRLAMQADLFVEWNPINRPFYGLMPRFMPRRFLFGPYVFPQNPPPRAPGRGAVFVGNVNDRRQGILDAHPEIKVMDRTATIEQINAAIAEADAMVNLHSMEGTYTEVPRVLMALLAGKALVSEALSAPFAQPCYLPLGAGEGEAAREASYAALCDLAAHYPISEAVNRAHRAS